jgi:hypothetical protein
LALRMGSGQLRPFASSSWSAMVSSCGLLS